MDLEPAVFFRTLRAREAMLLHGRATSAVALARLFRLAADDMREDLDELVRAGLVNAVGARYALSEDGEASVRWSAPPPPDGVILPRWAGELARAIAEHYGVETADMLRSTEPAAAVVARSRLCFALYARGWPIERIEEHFGLPAGWAVRAVERWKRLRDALPARSGPELRAWRERLGLTQAEAARRLGVSRRTVLRAEQAGAFSQRMAVARV